MAPLLHRAAIIRRRRLYSSCVRSSMLHGSETWPVRKENEVARQRAEMRMLRWMCNVKVKDRVPSKELRERLGIDDITGCNVMGVCCAKKTLIMVALCNRADHYIFILFLSSFFFFLLSFFSSPNLSGRKLDVYHTLAHDVALVRISNAGLKCAARGSLQIQDAKKSSSRHHRTTLSDHIFATKACIDNRKKKLVKQQYLLHMS